MLTNFSLSFSIWSREVARHISVAFVLVQRSRVGRPDDIQGVLVELPNRENLACLSCLRFFSYKGSISSLP